MNQHRKAMSSSLSFGFEVGWPAFAAVYVSFTIPSSSGALKSIGVSESPQASAYNLYEINYTWYFNYYGPYEISNNVTFIDGFTVRPELGAQIAIPNYSPGNTYWLYLPFNAEVQTYCWSAFWVCLGWFAVPHASVTFGSFSIVFLGTCCCFGCLLWLYPLIMSIAYIDGVVVLCLIQSGFLSLSMTISLCMACITAPHMRLC